MDIRKELEKMEEELEEMQRETSRLVKLLSFAWSRINPRTDPPEID